VKIWCFGRSYLAAQVSTPVVVLSLSRLVWSSRVFIMTCFVSSVLRLARKMPPPPSLSPYHMNCIRWSGSRYTVYVLCFFLQLGLWFTKLAIVTNSSRAVYFCTVSSLTSHAKSPGSTFPIQGHRPRSRYIFALQSVAVGQLCPARHSLTTILARILVFCLYPDYNWGITNLDLRIHGSIY